MVKQLELELWTDEDNDNIPAEDDSIASWSYGVVELNNGDLVLAEIFWDELEQPLAWTEAHMVFDPEEGVEGLQEALRNALNDIEADPTPIKESYFKAHS